MASKRPKTGINHERDSRSNNVGTPLQEIVLGYRQRRRNTEGNSIRLPATLTRVLASIVSEGAHARGRFDS